MESLTSVTSGAGLAASFPAGAVDEAIGPVGVGAGVAAGLGLGAFEVAGVALVLLLVPVMAPSTGTTTPSLFTGSTGFLIISGIE